MDLGRYVRTTRTRDARRKESAIPRFTVSEAYRCVEKNFNYLPARVEALEAGGTAHDSEHIRWCNGGQIPWGLNLRVVMNLRSGDKNGAYAAWGTRTGRVSYSGC